MIRRFKKYWWAVLLGAVAILAFILKRSGKIGGLNVGVVPVPPPNNNSEAEEPEMLPSHPNSNAPPLLPASHEPGKVTYTPGDIGWDIPWFMRPDNGMEGPPIPDGSYADGSRDGSSIQDNDWAVTIGKLFDFGGPTTVNTTAPTNAEMSSH